MNYSRDASHSPRGTHAALALTYRFALSDDRAAPRPLRSPRSPRAARTNPWSTMLPPLRDSLALPARRSAGDPRARVRAISIRSERGRNRPRRRCLRERTARSHLRKYLALRPLFFRRGNLNAHHRALRLPSKRREIETLVASFERGEAAARKFRLARARARARAGRARLLVSRRTKPSGGVLLDFLNNVGTTSGPPPVVVITRDYRLNESANSPARSSSGRLALAPLSTRSRLASDSLPTAAPRCGGEIERKRKKRRRGNGRRDGSNGETTDP